MFSWYKKPSFKDRVAGVRKAFFMSGKRILLVDYDPKSLNHTREVLEGAGFAVSTCGDGLTALDQFKSLSPDLVLLSAMLPKMHGFEVCSNIRKMPGGEKTPVVLITDVYKGKRYRVDAINKYGATEYIEKPIEELGIFAKVTTTKRVYTVAKKLGLSLCPEEVGPQLRIEYKDQPDGETLFIAMEPVLISSGYEKMFDVKCQGGKKWLGFTSGSSNYTWRPFDRFVFVIQ